MLIFDIGANIGKYSIVNYINNETTIIAVEASPKNFSILKENVKNYSNIIPLEFAVSKTKDFVTFYDSDVSTISTLNKDWLTDEKSRFCNYTKYKEIDVKTITLDELIEKYGIPDLLKIDVESAEEEVVKTLTSKAKVLCFEWAAEWKESIVNTITYLESLGYSEFNIQNEDKYTYRPQEYNLISSDVKEIIMSSRNKIDWGMIWCK
jgi:FkbM family methyltransferase